MAEVMARIRSQVSEDDAAQQVVDVVCGGAPALIHETTLVARFEAAMTSWNFGAEKPAAWDWEWVSELALRPGGVSHRDSASNEGLERDRRVRYTSREGVEMFRLRCPRCGRPDFKRRWSDIRQDLTSIFDHLVDTGESTIDFHLLAATLVKRRG